MTKRKKPKAVKTTGITNGRYVPCPNCGCRLMKNGYCKICGYTIPAPEEEKTEPAAE